VVGLAALVLLVVTGGSILRWDLRSYQWITDHQNQRLARFMLRVSATAEAPRDIPPLIALGVVVSLVRRRWWPVLASSAASVALIMLVYYGKLFVTHVHAGLVPDSNADVGFPSGHASTAVVMSGTALLLLANQWSPRWRRIALAVVVVYAGLVGVSRLYLRVHRLSDVVGGWLLGTIIVLTVALVVAPRMTARNAARAAG
jgi:membrane-associated phospholipid phosphatase